jgi:hypothetical protein
MTFHYMRISRRIAKPDVTDLLTTPLRAGRHLAIWVIWHTTGVSLLSPPEIPESSERVARSSHGRPRAA